MNFIKVDPAVFRDMKYEIKVSPFGEKVCCCGYANCTDLDCLIASPTKGN